MKLLIAVLAAFCVSGTAMAQEGQRPPPPDPEVAPIPVEGPAAPTMSTIAPAIQPENTWVLDLSNGGRVLIQLRPDHAANHVQRIKGLTRAGFYNGIIFHRVIEGFMAQGGDPTGTGAGSSDLPNLPAEFNHLPHLRGAVAMARAQDRDSANSQFYIMFVPRMSMDRQYTVFGRVVSGMEHVDAIERGSPPPAPTRIIRASIASDNVPAPTAEEIAAANRVVAPISPVPGQLDVRSLGQPIGSSPAGQAAPQSPQSPPSGAPTTPQS